ncbi:MAG: SMC-Scp complex subunit ScpB [Anaerolineales bacterium]|jgi:segregation and condensation protein B
MPLKAVVESLLFVSAEPVALSTLSLALELPESEIEQALEELDLDYRDRGLQIQRLGDRVRLTTSPRAAPQIEKLLGLKNTTTLTKAALEALAIIAYRQPLTRPQIDAIRGVNSDSVLQSLLSKGLIEEMGRTEGPGRPILYGVTSMMLQHFGLGSTKELPVLALEEAEAPLAQGESGGADTVLKE